MNKTTIIAILATFSVIATSIGIISTKPCIFDDISLNVQDNYICLADKDYQILKNELITKIDNKKPLTMEEYFIYVAILNKEVTDKNEFTLTSIKTEKSNIITDINNIIK